MSTEQPFNSSLNLEAFPDTDQPSEVHSLLLPASQNELAWLDFKEGIKKWRIWLMLAYQDISLRYRRSVLGPFWITISMAITVYSMGFLYSHLFHIELQRYFPFLVSGMLGWSLISTLVIETTDGLLVSHGIIRQIKLPYSLHIHRIATRNMIIFFHNVLVIIPILAIFHEVAKINLCTLLLIPGLVVIYINSISFGILLAIIGARYRDISQVIKSMVQVVFFITPVMWEPEAIHGYNHLFIDLNPFYALLELIRSPLLGKTPSLYNLLVVFGITLFGLLISSCLFIRYRARLIYWL